MLAGCAGACSGIRDEDRNIAWNKRKPGGGNRRVKREERRKDSVMRFEGTSSALLCSADVFYITAPSLGEEYVFLSIA